MNKEAMVLKSDGAGRVQMRRSLGIIAQLVAGGCWRITEQHAGGAFEMGEGDAVSMTLKDSALQVGSACGVTFSVPPVSR